MIDQMLVSIIIPVYNRAGLLPETLDSIISQTYMDWECILVDDGSTDESESVIKEYLKLDSRFRFFNRPPNKPKGANTCRNFGFEKSKGNYVNWFDSDDIMHQDFLKEKVEALNSNPKLDFCCCLYATFQGAYKNNSPTTVIPKLLQSNNYIEDYLLHDLAFSTNSPLWKMDFLRGKHLFDLEMVRGQEWDFHLRMLTYNPKYKYLNKVLFFVRRGNESITTNVSKSIEAQQSIFKYFNNAFEIVKNTVTKNKTILLQYVFYRQAVNYYTISTMANGFLGRLKMASTYVFKLLYYCFKSKTNISVKLNIILGIFVLIITGKGYRYFYYPSFDKRTNKRSKR